MGRGWPGRKGARSWVCGDGDHGSDKLVAGVKWADQKKVAASSFVKNLIIVRSK